jgi:uncharacterized protein YbjT (DUF2867 family)
MGIVVVVFGATGTAGSAVVRRCLDDERVREIRAITRRQLELKDPRLVEAVCTDFSDLAPHADALSGVDACFFCLGTSASGITADAYRTITVGYALAAEEALGATSPGHVFHFISGRGASPASRLRWTRMKAEAESGLAALATGRLAIYRPGYIYPSHGRPALAARATAALLRPFPTLMITADDLARAMLNVQFGTAEGVLENQELRRLASA